MKANRQIPINTLYIVLVVVAAALIFAYRYQPAFHFPNFYAEDGKVFVGNILHHNPIAAMGQTFNGYLVVGQYLVAYAGLGLNAVLGAGLSNLPFHLAVASCLFLGFTAALPFILFRRQLGTKLSLLTVLLSALVPLRTFDYAVIGTIGNLKFAFIYIAFLLVIYRNLNSAHKKRCYAIDAALLLCILTNVAAVFLLPATLWPYRQTVRRAVRKRSLRLLLQATLASSLFTTIAAGLYTCAMYLRGIPKLPGYLDTPYKPAGTGVLLDRVTNFSLTYPVTHLFDTSVPFGEHAMFFLYNLLVVSMLAVFLYLGARTYKNRQVLAIGSWAIFTSVVLFVANRPGVSNFYQHFNHFGGPDQFFYATNFIFIFMIAWVLRDWFKRLTGQHQLLALLVVCGYLTFALPYGSSWEKIHPAYAQLGTATENVAKACKQPGKNVILQLYPSKEWVWSVEKQKACN